MLELKIEELLQSKFQEPEFEDCYLVDIEFHNDKDLKVYMDSDGPLTLEKCRKVSRFLEAYLDDSVDISEKYRLEVSSPGLNRPLKYLRQYQKNIGRNVSVKLSNGDQVEGQLKQASDHGITITTAGKGKKNPPKDIDIALSSIKETLVIPSF